MYTAVGVAFIPAGALYSLGISMGWNEALTSVVCLGLGFLTAHVVWTKLRMWLGWKKLQGWLAAIGRREVPAMREEKHTAAVRTVTVTIPASIFFHQTATASWVGGLSRSTEPFAGAPIIVRPISDQAVSHSGPR